MAVNWLWKAKRGEIIFKEKKSGEYFKVGLYGGNVLAALIYRYRKKNEETGKLEKWYNFIAFIDDINHLKRCLKDNIMLEDLIAQDVKVVKVRIRQGDGNKYTDSEMIKVAKLFVEYGYKVELYK